ncbi:hypothetical protein CLOSTASPAR_06437 [[Clostridium] asparagiforme DSM 15981]|uniref:Uncharacterized protein n=1 Tax=[Clostridium] asparagiforme DSM 15981 TaxID=518636 RepID=C0DAY2_9FIRM|nr:hypothetical protein CLOSTASPAR_06437 [[Clostridium] asparagiforme DSM 15981]
MYRFWIMDFPIFWIKLEKCTLKMECCPAAVELPQSFLRTANFYSTD